MQVGDIRGSQLTGGVVGNARIASFPNAFTRRGACSRGTLGVRPRIQDSFPYRLDKNITHESFSFKVGGSIKH